MNKYADDLVLEFNDYSKLSYDDLGEESIQLLLDGKIVGLVEVSTDIENNKREYIIINSEIIYLDTIKKQWEA